LISPIGKTYKVTYEVSDYVSGEARCILGGFTFGQITSSNGVVTEYLTASNASSNTFVYIETRGSGFIGSIDNVSVKEYLGQEVVPDSGCGSWLLEPQSTNLITYSEDFSDASWIKSDSSITSNSVISPDGSLNADKIIATATNGSHAVFVSISSATSSGSSYCYSFFAKAEQYTKTAIRIGGGGYSAQPMAVINLLNGTVVSQQGFTSVSVTNFNNGWYKINAVFTATASVAPNIQPIADGFITTADNYTYTGDGTSGIYIWGAQLEQQSYATSYIPTNGAANTRLQDIADNSGNSTLINSTEGVLYAEMAALADDGTNRRISLNDGSDNNRINLMFTANSNQIICNYKVSGTTRVTLSNIVTSVQNLNKIAFKWSSGDFALFVNGIKTSVDSSTIMMSENSLSSLDFRDGNALFNFYGKAKALAVYKEALTDAELQSLTTI
jgi:hypothetical protein